MKRLLVLILLFVVSQMSAFAASEEVKICCSWGDIAATLATPDKGSDSAVVIVAGSGPTDRNGNSGLNLNTYAYKRLSDGLVEAGYAVLRYDKRGVGGSVIPAEQVPSLLYDDYVADAERCVAWLREQGYKHIAIAGHSEGGSIAIEVAARGDVDGVVLLAAPGYPMDEILMWQLSEQLLPTHFALMMSAQRIIALLKRGESVAEESVPKELMSLFHPVVQPFLMSSIQRNPCALIAQCSEPMLIISGGRDIQVTVANGERLLAAAQSAEHVVFENMCHVLKDAETADRVEQLLGVYTNSQQSLTEGLVPTIVEFLDRVIIK
ncbi:MAG: alpha/beta fold hydrolase [Alistipes sp.]|nr:alpha/beta fold hydrolase [Alistipes sp.]